jgi:hypothetical protein
MKSPCLGRLGSSSFLLSIALFAAAPRAAAQTPATMPPGPDASADSSALPPTPPPVDAFGGDVVTLPRLGLNIVLPSSTGRWRIEASPGNEFADLVRSVGGGPSDPKLEVEFNLMTGLTCKIGMGAVMTLKTLPNTAAVAKPTYLPPEFQASGALELPVAGYPGVSACAETPRGALMIRLRYDGVSIHSVDRQVVAALLTSASRAAGAPEVAPIPDPPPRRVRLPISGLEIELPTADTAWRVDSRTIDGQVNDVIERTSPKRPLLMIRVLRDYRRNRICRGSDRLDPDGGVIVNRPDYLTPEWSQAVIEEDLSESVRASNICGNAGIGGLVLVQIVYGASLRDRDLLDARPILASLARAGRVGQTGGGYTGSPSSYSRSRSSTPSRYDDGPSLSRWEIGAFQLSPDDERLDKSLGAVVGVDFLSANPEKVVSFALHGAVSIGFDSTSNIPFDGRAGLGLGFSIGPVLLVPLVGAGLDTAGGGDENSYRIPLGGYWDVEGRFLLAINDELRLGAGALRAERGGEGPSEETRLSAHVSKSFGGNTFWSLGLRYINYGDAKLIGASFGSTL